MGLLNPPATAPTSRARSLARRSRNAVGLREMSASYPLLLTPTSFARTALPHKRRCFQASPAIAGIEHGGGGEQTTVPLKFGASEHRSRSLPLSLLPHRFSPSLPLPLQPERGSDLQFLIVLVEGRQAGRHAGMTAGRQPWLTPQAKTHYGAVAVARSFRPLGVRRSAGARLRVRASASVRCVVAYANVLPPT